MHADNRLTEAVPGLRATSPPQTRPQYDNFDQFFRKQFRLVVAYLLTLGASFEEAEDATQQAMIYAERKWDTIHANPGSWVRTVARRAFVKERAHDSERDVREGRTGVTPSVSPDPADQVVGVQRVVDAIDKLPNQQRTVMILRAFTELTPAEIAEVLGGNPDTVRSNLAHARNKLAHLLDRPQSGDQRPEHPRED